MWSCPVVGRLVPVAAVTLFLAALVGAAPAAGSAVACQWSGQQSADPGSLQNRLLGVAMSSPCNGWAVGYYQKAGYDPTLIEHWDGQSWTRQPSPNGPGALNQLDGVAAVSSTDAWAVGTTGRRTLVEHWGGRAWKVQPSASPGGASRHDWLFGVAAVSSQSAWAVGYQSDPAKHERRGLTLIEHWDGKAWKVQPSPNPAITRDPSDHLFAVAAVSPADAWAVGQDRTDNVYRTLIEHWNGKRWEVRPSPANPSRRNSELDGVAVVSPTDVWAVGFVLVNRRSHTLIEHWNGSTWQVQPSPIGYLNGVAAVSPTDAWAVGDTIDGQQLLEHWNGSTWELQPSPSSPTTASGLYGIAAVSPSDVWAVGVRFSSPYDYHPANRTLIEQWNGTAWTG